MPANTDTAQPAAWLTCSIRDRDGLIESSANVESTREAARFYQTHGIDFALVVETPHGFTFTRTT